MKMYKLFDDIYDDYHNNYYTRPLNKLVEFAKNIFNAMYYTVLNISEKAK